MCGRYNIITDADALLDAFRILNDLDPDESVTSFNIAPSQRVPVITESENGRQLSRMRWGMIPAWNKDSSPKFTPFNARSENIAEKSFFRTPFKRKRCLIPASGFYEWQKNETGKVPFHIRLKNKEPFTFAGLWDEWQSPNGKLHSCTIITTAANKLMQPIHQRMPVILSAEQHTQWLNCNAFDKEQLQSFLKPYNPDEMEAYIISNRVNNARNNSEDLITPIA